MSEEYQCQYCGAEGTGLNWPSPRMCDVCKPKEAACPFCGTWGATFGVNDEAAQEFYLECCVCHARGPREPLQDLAVSYWNRRKQPREPEVVYVAGKFLHRKARSC